MHVENLVLCDGAVPFEKIMKLIREGSLNPQGDNVNCANLTVTFRLDDSDRLFYTLNGGSLGGYPPKKKINDRDGETIPPDEALSRLASLVNGQ